MFMLMYREISWWYWLLTTLLLFYGLAGNQEGFWLAIALSMVQVVHFRLHEDGFAAFTVQVRMAYTAMLILFLWGPLNILFWIPAIGTLAQVLFGYCTLARCLSLMPWNRREPLTADLLRRTFLSRPVKGSVMQGLPSCGDQPRSEEGTMSVQLNEIVIHLDESVDEATLAALEQNIRQEQGVTSVGHRPNQNHLMMVVYDTAVARGANFLHHFRERGLHAQLIGM